MYLTLPVGAGKTCFNAHRIVPVSSVVELLREFDLEEFSAVGDDGCYGENADLGAFDHASYACGMFIFRRRRDDQTVSDRQAGARKLGE
jgi:hypothetical protein